MSDAEDIIPPEVDAMFGELFKLSDMATHGNATAQTALDFMHQTEDGVMFTVQYKASEVQPFLEWLANTAKLFFMARVSAHAMEHLQNPTEVILSIAVKTK